MNATLDSHPELVQRIQTALADREVTVASICSGWGVAEMCITSINEYLEQHAPGKARTCWETKTELIFKVSWDRILLQSFVFCHLRVWAGWAFGSFLQL